MATASTPISLKSTALPEPKQPALEQAAKVKARKRALFELWHKEKLAEIESYSSVNRNNCDNSDLQATDSKLDPQPLISSPLLTPLTDITRRQKEELTEVESYRNNNNSHNSCDSSFDLQPADSKLDAPSQISSPPPTPTDNGTSSVLWPCWQGAPPKMVTNNIKKEIGEGASFVSDCETSLEEGRRRKMATSPSLRAPVIRCSPLSTTVCSPSSLPTLLSQPTQFIRALTSPKLSRHNDAAFYPNIQCILCQEWVCSRNRFMHIESHLQYRPYKCGICGYDNRKQIFIDLHIKRVHKGQGGVVYLPDPELEKRAWSIAEQCLQHTRDVLMNDTASDTDSVNGNSAAGGDAALVNGDSVINCVAISHDLIKPYKDCFRPQIFNNQRAEKSQLIEETRHLGLIPDFSAVAGREERCQLCQSYVLRNQSLLEEHGRSHLSKATYRCLVPKCNLVHFSRSFIQRHTKEVHKTRKTAVDLLEHDVHILREFLKVCPMCFPKFFVGANLERLKSNYLHILTYDYSHGCGKATDATDDSGTPNPASSVSRSEAGQQTPRKCLGCQKKLRLFPTDQFGVCSSCYHGDEGACSGSIICKVCYDMVPGMTLSLEQHALKHMNTYPFQCSFCDFSDWKYVVVAEHALEEHADDSVSFKWEPAVWRTRWKLQFISCFAEAVAESLTSKQTACADDALKAERCCTLCLTNVADYPASLFQHTLKHVSSLIYYCIYCQARFPEKNPLTLHIRSEHNDCPEVLVTNNKEVEGERRRVLAVCFPNL